MEQVLIDVDARRGATAAARREPDARTPYGSWDELRALFPEEVRAHFKRELYE